MKKSLAVLTMLLTTSNVFANTILFCESKPNEPKVQAVVFRDENNRPVYVGPLKIEGITPMETLRTGRVGHGSPLPEFVHSKTFSMSRYDQSALILRESKQILVCTESLFWNKFGN